MKASIAPSRSGVWERVRASAAWRLIHSNALLLINSGSVVGAKAVNSLLGFLFWIAAAHFYTTEAVGLASASLSAMQLLGTIGALGLGTLLIRELPRPQGGRASLISAARIVTGGVSGVLGVGFALIAPFFSPEFAPLAVNIGQVVLFALGSFLNAITVILDQAYIGLLRGQLGLWRNLVFAASKLVLLVVIGLAGGGASSTMIYAIWALGNLLSLAMLAPSTLSGGPRLRALAPRWSALHGLRGPAAAHHALNLSLYSPEWVLPILTTALISAEANAGFYMAMMIGGLMAIVPAALTTALLAVGSAEPAALAQRMRVSLGLSLASGVVGAAVLWVGAEWILGLFGASYAQTASSCLRLLAFWVFPSTINLHYVAISQIEGRLLRAIIITAVGGVAGLGLAAAGAVLWGLNGLTLGWMAAACGRALAAMPAVYRATRERPVEAL